jgi:hypothetical protein
MSHYVPADLDYFQSLVSKRFRLHEKIITAHTKFKCAVCGKITAGRLPIQNKHKGDGSFRFPRRHYVNGKLCDGVFEEAEWVDI